MSSSKRRGETPEEPIPSKRARVDDGLTKDKAKHDDAPSQFNLYRTLVAVTGESESDHLCCHLELLHFKAPKLYRKKKRRLRLSIEEDGRPCKLRLTRRALHMFLQWLYTGRITALPPALGTPDLHTRNDTCLFQSSSVKTVKWPELIDGLDVVQLSVFSRKWDIPHLRNCSSDLLVASCLHSATAISATVIRAAYDHNLWELTKFARCHAWADCPITPWSTELEALPVRYLIAIINMHAGNQEGPRGSDWSSMDPCEFHEHPPGEKGNWCRGMEPSKISLDSADTSLVESFGDTVWILVGEQEVSFPVHRQLLCHASTYFAGAFNSSFQEAKDGQVRLLDTTENTVAMFVRWLYSGTIFPWPMFVDAAEMPTIRGEPHPSLAISSTAFDQRPSPEDSRDFVTDAQNEKLFELANLYIFGDAQDVRELRNDVMSTIIAYWQLDGSWVPPSREVISHVFESVATGYKRCPFKRYLIAAAAQSWSSADFSSSANTTMPAEFLAGVMRTQAKKARTGERPGKDPPWNWKLCRFHEHQNENELRRCKEKNAKLRLMVKNKTRPGKK